MSNKAPQMVGINIPNPSSIELQTLDNNIDDADAANDERDNIFCSTINIDGSVKEIYFVKIDGKLNVIDFAMDGEKEGLNKANTLMPEAATDDSPEYITPPLTLEDFNLNFNTKILMNELISSKIQDIQEDVIEIDFKVKAPEQKHEVKNESPLKKRKLHEISEPLSDEIEEKRRIGAINAKKNRDRNKGIVDTLNKELAKEKEKNKHLENQLKEERNATKIARLEKENSDLRYQLLFDKYQHN